MIERLLIAGAGGQGVVLTGRIVAFAAMDGTGSVMFIPSYGAEVRGGFSSCQLVLSDGEVASPVPEAFDTVMLLSERSAARWASMVALDGTVLADSDAACVAGLPRVKLVPASVLAAEQGDARLANFVMLGVYLGSCARVMVSVEAIRNRTIELLAGKGREVVVANLRALEAGLEYARRASCANGGQGVFGVG